MYLHIALKPHLSQDDYVSKTEYICKVDTDEVLVLDINKVKKDLGVENEELEKENFLVEFLKTIFKFGPKVEEFPAFVPKL